MKFTLEIKQLISYVATFRPTHERAPIANGTNAWGFMTCGLVLLSSRIHRSGIKRSGSEKCKGSRPAVNIDDATNEPLRNTTQNEYTKKILEN